MFSCWFCLTADMGLGLGSYANFKGGKHKKQFMKQAVKAWVDGHAGCFKELFAQISEIFLGAPTIFQELIPNVDDLLSNIWVSWTKQFGPSIQDCCSCCGRSGTCDEFSSFAYAFQNSGEDTAFSPDEMTRVLFCTQFEDTT